MGDKKNKENDFSLIAGDDIEIIDDEELLSELQDEKEADEPEDEEGCEEAEPEDEEGYEEAELELNDDLDDSEQHDDIDYLDKENSDEDLNEENLDDDYDGFPDDEDDKIAKGDELIEKHRRKKRRRRIILIVILALIVMYGAVAVYFDFHFFPNTKVNGVGFSLSSAEQVQTHMKEEVKGYTLSMKESDGGTEMITGSDIDIEYVADDSVEKLIKKQNPLLWITGLWKSQNIESSVGVKYDKDKLAEVLENLDCLAEENQIPSVSAKPEFTGEKFEITAEQMGTAIDKDKFEEAIVKAINGFQSEVDLIKEDCYILPKYTKDSPEVAEACEKMNSELGANITLDFSPNTEVVDSSVISPWITVDDNMQVTFNQDAVKQYIADLAAKYDTVGKTRNFTTATGNVVQVEGGGYGWKIDQDAEYNALITNIQNAETVTREPNYSSRAATHDANDWGSTYAEVDLTAQHMYFIQNGQIAMQCDIVTGNPNKGNATPQGMYSLYYKQRNQVLRGKKLEDGTYEYESPVDYWMPFNGGIGFHDASWQSAFGGARYQTYGSHGCVNMPPASAGELYNLIQAGTPIICHY